MGTASEADRFFGQQALELDFVTPEQLEECLALRTKSIADDAPMALADILVERKHCTDVQIEAVQLRVRFIELRDQDRAFGKQCVKQGWISLQQLDSALEIQRKIFLKKKKIRSLGEILVQKGMLAPEIQEKVVAMFGSGGASAMPAAATPPAPSAPVGDLIPAAVLDSIPDEPDQVPAPPPPGGAPPTGDPTEMRAPAPGTQKVALPGPRGAPRKACPLCKTLVLSGLSLCPTCGAPFCPQCGGASPARSAACVGCGHAFAPVLDPVIPGSVQLWLQPPYVYVLGGALCVAVAGLILVVGNPPPPPHQDDPFYQDMRTSKDPKTSANRAPNDPTANLPAATGDDRDFQLPECYDGTLVASDGGVHTGRIQEYRDKVQITTKWGKHWFLRTRIKELRQGIDSAPGPSNDAQKPPQPGNTAPPANTPAHVQNPANTPGTGPAPANGTAVGPTPKVPKPGPQPPAGGFEAEPPEELPEELPALPELDDLKLVQLKDGREMSGQVTRTGDIYEIRVKMGTMRVPAAEVAQVVTSPDQEYVDAARAVAEQGATGHFEFAQRLRAEGKAKWARRELLLAVQADPGHAGAQRALGRFESGGRWRRAEGMVRFAQVLFAAGRIEEAGDALAALLRAAEDPATQDAPIAPREIKFQAAELLLRCQLRTRRIAEARQTCTRMNDWATGSQRSRVKVLENALRTCSPDGTVEVRSDEVAVDMLDDAVSALALQAGPQPLWDARVLDIVVRREASAVVARVKDLMEQGARCASGDPDDALQRYENAEAMCDDANELYPGFAKGYQLESVRQQIPLLFRKAELHIKKANECYPTKFKYAYDKTTKRMTPDSVKEFIAHQREWNTQTERCKAVVDKSVRLAGRYPAEMQERLDTLRGYQRYLNEELPKMRREIEAFRAAIK